MRIRTNFLAGVLILGAGLACGQTTPETHNGSGFNKAAADLLVANLGLLAKTKRLVDYGQDFLDFAKSSTSPEYEIASHLAKSASTAAEEIDAARTLLQIYETMSCKEDRETVKMHLQTTLQFSSSSRNRWRDSVYAALGHFTGFLYPPGTFPIHCRFWRCTIHL
jgi:hypothetical protein